MSYELAPDTVARAVTFVVVLLAALVGHQLGDHVAQTDRQAAEKAGRGRRAATALAGHLFGYHAVVVAVVAGTVVALGLPLSPAGGGAALALSVVSHALLDRRWPVRAVLRATGSPRFAETTSPVCGMYVADQALHWLTLLLCALLMVRL
jgi:hypothetical protein